MEDQNSKQKAERFRLLIDSSVPVGGGKRREEKIQ